MGEFGKSGELGETGHAGKGICGSRHDREGEMGHAGKGICGVGMTGEPLAPAQKEKASLRRVRSAHLARAREQKYTPKKISPIRGDFDIIYE